MVRKLFILPTAPCLTYMAAKGTLVPVALKCLCDLLRGKSQFNFAVNIMDVIAQHVGKAEWDEVSQSSSSCWLALHLAQTSITCLQTIIHVFENDAVGTDSLHLVRLLSKVIKSRSFRVHPALLSCFLHLRLRDSLGGIRASGDRVDRPDKRLKGRVNKFAQKAPKKGQANPSHVSKKMRKSLKEKEAVQQEYAEAEMAITSEEKQKEVRTGTF